jgi:ABC-type transporter Mla subunit MlaD
MERTAQEIVEALAQVADRVENLEQSLRLPMGQDVKTRASISAALLQARAITRTLEDALGRLTA